MSNNIETNNHDLDINTLKSNINKLIQENKQLLESNKQLKIENKKLRDLIDMAASDLGIIIQNILGVSGLLLDKNHQEYFTKLSKEYEKSIEDIKIGFLHHIYRAASKLNRRTEGMKRDVSEIDSKKD